jgi:hypothetical protein
VSVLLGCAGGGFGPPSAFAVGDRPGSVAVGDFNGDGDPDLAVTNGAADSVSVLLGGAGGGFGPPSAFAVGDWPLSVAVGDFNGDGDPDLAVASNLDDSVSVLLGGAGGGFGPPSMFPVGDAPTSVTVADFDGNDRPDLAVVNTDDRPDLAVRNTDDNNVSVLLNTAPSAIAVDSSAVTFPPQSESTISAMRTVRVFSTNEFPLRVRSVKTAGPASSDYLITGAPIATASSAVSGSACATSPRTRRR